LPDAGCARSRRVARPRSLRQKSVLEWLRLLEQPFGSPRQAICIVQRHRGRKSRAESAPQAAAADLLEATADSRVDDVVASGAEATLKPPFAASFTATLHPVRRHQRQPATYSGVGAVDKVCCYHAI
jgi:hypothetical protein